jgi:hypothetical protein
LKPGQGKGKDVGESNLHILIKGQNLEEYEASASCGWDKGGAEGSRI